MQSNSTEILRRQYSQYSSVTQANMASVQYSLKTASLLPIPRVP